MEEKVQEREEQKQGEKAQNSEKQNTEHNGAEIQEKQRETQEESKKDINKNLEEQRKAQEKFKQVKEKPKKIKEEKRKMGEKNKKRKILPIIITAIMIIIIGIIISTVFALANINKDTIVSGVKIEGIEVSGLTAEEAKGKIESIYKEKLETEIPVQYNEYETTINANLLETQYNVEKAIKKAVNIGKEGNIFTNNYNILFALMGKQNIKVEMQINEEASKKIIEDIGTNLPGVVIESTYYIENDKLIITKGQAGVKIDTEKMLNEVKEKLDNPEKIVDYINIPVTEVKPTEIDIDKIHEEVYKEVQDAYYTQNPFEIHPEVEGIDFDVEEAKKALEEDKEEYEISLKITKPKVTTNQIGTEAFPDQLATFKTNYDGGDKDRTTNLQIACNKINGKVVMPNETFSYNKTLGARTAAAGYKNAKVYEAGQVVDGIGGGICQISSTLYNAVLRANLEIVERKNHQFVTSYVEAGMDATVVYGMTDFKFKNTRKYPVKIIASAKNGVATVSIYGIKEGEEYTFSFRTVTVSTIPTSTKYIDDPTLEAGKEKVKQKGANGKKTETYMTKMLNGKIISTTIISRDTYDAMQKIILRGTKGATNTNTKTESNKTNSTETTNKANNKNGTTNENTTNVNTTNKETGTNQPTTQPSSTQPTTNNTKTDTNKKTNSTKTETSTEQNN